MLALIDGDIVTHRVGYTTDNDPFWVAKARCDEMLDGILTKTKADTFRIYLSDSKENNFRYNIFPLYKANRIDQKRPVHLESLKEHLLVNWGALIAHGHEADDALGIDQGVGTVICSIDKDLLQIPGLHYNFVKDVFTEIDLHESNLRFYSQMLIGDTSDNIRGCRGIGPAKSAKAFEGCKEEVDFLEVVYNLYQKQEEGMSTEDILQHMLTIGRLLRIKQSEQEELWTFPHDLILDTQ